MHCPRLKHFVRLDASGAFGKCGHMTKGKVFKSIDDMQQSDWLKNIEDQMSKDVWPAECVRCKLTEETSNTSVRLDMIERDRMLRAIDKNYLIVGGVLDNVCNSACQSCNSTLSTKIGSLETKNYKKINNYKNFFLLPQEHILEVDINGGEPTASPNYKKLLKKLPKSVKIVRLNTNGSRLIPEIITLLDKGIRLIITLSFDGTESVHDYVRWPIKWIEYKKNVYKYLELRKKYKNLRLNFWTTLSCLNVGDFENILQFSIENNIDHAYGFCIRPNILDIRYENKLTLDAKQKLSLSKDKLVKSIGLKCGSLKENNSKDLKTFIKSQDDLRKISFTDYFNLDFQTL